MTSLELSESFTCGVDKRYARIPFLSRGGGSSWPLMRLELEPEIFVLCLLRPLHWIAPTRLRYEEVAEAQVHTEWAPWIRLHLADPSRGDIVVTTPNDGVIKLAERLEEHGVHVIPE